jgi:glycosyltransferase involved in cell wall biosynthesis
VPRRLGILLDDRFRPSPAGMLGESPMLRLQVGFLRWFDEVVLISRVFPESARFDAPYLVDTPGVRVVPLPAYPRIESLFLAPWRWWPEIERVLARELPGLDAIWLNFGHPVSLRALAYAQRLPALRAFAVMRGAYARDAELRGRGPRPWRWLAGRVMAASMRVFARRARALDVPCIGIGYAEPLRRLGVRALEMPFSVLSKEDLARAPGPDPALACDLLVVGRLDAEKGVDVLVDALPQIRAAGRPATLRIVGSGACEAELRAQAERLGVAERVRFDGHVSFGPALFARYASAALLVIPSHTEGVPKTAYEAMAFGLPVVATSVGGLPDVVGRAQERGRLVPRGDASALARAVNALLGDRAELEKARAAVRAFAPGFTRESQLEKLMAFALPELAKSPA